MKCNILIVEIGFCRKLRCDIKVAERAEKYSLLAAAMKTYWGRVDFVVVPIGHAGTTLLITWDGVFIALSTYHLGVERVGANNVNTDPN